MTVAILMNPNLVGAVAQTIQLLIFGYLYRANRSRFFRYLIWAWTCFAGVTLVTLIGDLRPGLPGVAGLQIVIGVSGHFLILAAGLDFRWGYAIRPVHALVVVAYTLLAAVYDPVIGSVRPHAVIGGLAIAVGGLAFWPRRRDLTRPRGARLLAMSLVAWGLHFMVMRDAFRAARPAYASFVFIYFLAVFAIVILVLDRARGEVAALKEFNERLIDGLGEGLRLVDGTFAVRHANRWMVEHFGAGAGRRCYDGLTVDGQPCPGCPLGTRASLTSPVRLHVVGPGDRRVELTCSSVRQPDGQVFLLELVEDVTEQERMRTRLSEAERLASMGELAAGMAHEIRNPLAAIVNATTLLEGHDTLAPEDRTATLSAVRKEARRLNTLLSNFLIFARPAEVKRVEGDLGDVIARVTRLLGEQQRNGDGLAVETRVDPAVPRFAFDADQLTQVVWNVVVNAIEVMRGRRGRLQILARPDGDDVVIEIADTGPGIPAANQRRIFEPFYSTRSVGTGLGLAIARRIVTAHGGDIDVASPAGAGARFIIRLPRS